MGPPPLEFLVVAIGFTFVMAAFGAAVHVVTGAAADFSWSVASGISDGIRRWAATAARERRRSVSPVAPVDVAPVHGVGMRSTLGRSRSLPGTRPAQREENFHNKEMEPR